MSMKVVPYLRDCKVNQRGRTIVIQVSVKGFARLWKMAREKGLESPIHVVRARMMENLGMKGGVEA